MCRCGCQCAVCSHYKTQPTLLLLLLYVWKYKTLNETWLKDPCALPQTSVNAQTTLMFLTPHTRFVKVTVLFYYLFIVLKNPNDNLAKSNQQKAMYLTSYSQDGKTSSSFRSCDSASPFQTTNLIYLHLILWNIWTAWSIVTAFTFLLDMTGEYWENKHLGNVKPGPLSWVHVAHLVIEHGNTKVKVLRLNILIEVTLSATSINIYSDLFCKNLT